MLQVNVCENLFQIAVEGVKATFSVHEYNVHVSFDGLVSSHNSHSMMTLLRASAFPLTDPLELKPSLSDTIRCVCVCVCVCVCACVHMCITTVLIVTPKLRF